MNYLRDLVHQFQWDIRFRTEIPYIRIAYIHQGSPLNKKYISFDDILDLDGNFLKINGKNCEESYIPLHRILYIENSQTGKIYYKNKISL